MSHAAIAAVLRLEGVSAGERLAAFSLASFATVSTAPGPARRSRRRGRGCAAASTSRPATHSSAAGWLRSIARRRARASPVVSLRFAAAGPWFDLEVNPGLVEAVLSYSRTRGSARVLLATLAAVADQHGTVAELSAEEIQAAAGMADSTYRRARAALLDSGELVLAAAGGGRARTNHWQIPDPSSINPEAVAVRSAAAGAWARDATAARDHATAGVRRRGSARLSLVEAVAGERKGPGLSGVSAVNPGQNRTVSA